jgi:adenine-specific DNA methylase
MNLTPKGGNDKIYTPDDLAKFIVKHFKPKGRIVEPSCGEGVFLKYMKADWYEIDKGKDFFDCKDTYDWAITNPPFSKMRKFLQHLYKLRVKNIVFLCPLNHIVGLKARVRDMIDSGYTLKKIILIDTPKEFPQSGFQWSINHIKIK